jgi:quinoprotein relay system zinc metallohydrolase 2
LRRLALVFLVLLSLAPPAFAQSMLDQVDLSSPAMTKAEIDRGAVLARIAAAPPGKPPDLSGLRLSGLDLSGIDFKRAILRNARLNNTRLVGADLDGATLDQAWALKADFTGASLKGASLFAAQLVGARLAKADLTGARIAGDLTGSDLRGANLTQANLSADMKNQSMGLMRAILKQARLDGAVLDGANLSRVMAEFASFRDASLRNANLVSAELGGADLRGADIAGADLANADVTSTRLADLRGEAQARNMDRLRNAARAFRDAGDAIKPLPVIEIAPGIYVFQGQHQLMSEDNRGAIANVGFIVGKRAVAVIDTGGSVAEGSALRASIRQVTPLPVAYVVNTHMHPDHIFGNAAFQSEKGVRFVGHHALAAALAARRDQYLTANARLLGPKLIAEVKIIPPDIAVDKTLALDLGGRVIEVTAWPVAHTDNDVTVLDRETGTLFAGDLVFMGHLPVIDGRLTGWLAVMDSLAKLKVARVVPGHGPATVSLVAALADQRRYLERLASDLRAIIRQGGDIARAAASAGQSERGRWSLFDEYNARNATAGFAELEWE